MEEYKPPLIELFKTALRATLEEDSHGDIDNMFLLAIENKTFPERTVANFIILASGYYEKDVIKEWMITNL